ncbi:hypothetical protein MTR67_012221 [Solanum verrucosum]|uniref:Uncharacterized protein n=1 Tax=Solanum verrucosum TaxID=315347 RepID=A0AAF0QE35_SOLVR|nr:hypothetical protein MTR67_012221 [Solanum verrucosum]
MKGVMFGKKGKLSPRYVGPYKILKGLVEKQRCRFSQGFEKESVRRGSYLGSRSSHEGQVRLPSVVQGRRSDPKISASSTDRRLPSTDRQLIDGPSIPSVDDPDNF